ncbi:MAG: tetratricopeptide repeat protein, partial [Candidatus Eiseniibacteriota bacterium]
MIAAAGALLMLTAAPTPAPADSVDALLAAGSYREADSLAAALLQAAEVDPGPDSVRFVEAIERVLRADVQQSRAGERQVEQAMRAVYLRERAHGESDPRVAAALDLLGMTLWPTGRLDEARAAAERALRILEATGGAEHDGERARALSILANVEMSGGDPQRAVERWIEVHALRERLSGAESTPAAQALHALGIAYRNAGRSLDALRTHRRALEIRERVLGTEHPDVAWTLLNLANVYYDLGDFAESARLNRRALGIREKLLGPEHVHVAVSLMNLGNALERSGDAAAAVPLHERALDIYERAYGPWHRSVAQVLNNLALAQATLGCTDAARPLFERSIAIRDSLLGPGSAEAARTRLRLGRLLLDANAPDEAERVLRQAAAANREHLGADHPFAQDATIALAEALLRLGRAGEALDLALEAERVTLQHLRITAQGLDEAQALIYTASRSSGLQVALTAAAAAPRDTAVVARTWDALARSRSVVLDEMAQRRHWAAAGGDTAALRLHARVAAARDRLAHLALGGADTLAAAIAAKREAEQALAEHSLAFRRELRGSGAGLAEIAAALPQGSALVTWAWYEDLFLGVASESTTSVVAFVLAADGPGPRAVPLGLARDVEAKVHAWLSAMRRPPDALRRGADEEACESLGRRVRETIWDPVAALCAGASRVFVAPESPLLVVPFAALPDGRGRTLAETGPVFCALAVERDLVAAAAREHGGGRGLLALGGPAFDADPAIARAAGLRVEEDPCAVLAGGRFAPLPGSAAEVTEIARAWESAERGVASEDRAKVLTGAAASERALREGAPGRRALHVAAHGFFLPESCAVSGSEDGADTAHPLLRGGLALAGANDRSSARDPADDGILTAEEIAGLDLDALEWVALSACDTGLGELDLNEGVLGLRRAFRAAGARALV